MIKYKLGDVVKVISKRVDNPANCEYDKFVGLEHYVSGEIEIKKYGNTTLLKSAMKVFKSGDILIARRNVYLKRASIVKFDGITSGDSIVLRVEDKLLRRIIPFVLNTDEFWGYAEKFSDGTMSKRLSPKVLLEYEFMLPQIAQQEKLADLLWAANNTKEAYKKLLYLTDELVKSQFIEMFGNPNEESKKWGMRPLGELTVNFNRSRKPVKEGDRKLMQGPYPYYGATGIVDHVNDYRLDGTYLLISEDGKALEFRNYDIAFIVSGKIWVNNHAHVLQCKDDLNMVFLQYFIKYLDISHWVTGIDQKKLNRENMEAIPIVVPPIVLQNKFGNFIKQTDKSKLNLEQNIVNLELTLKALMSKSFG
ncbi:restriction endonuclease subunit S [Paenibacillus sp. EKM202P]|uniref:restriction endonuclease subunit S n=1 Tax=unclassified Paenibacillus TaxID=185978 RepID=UPI0013EDF3A5|nr:MULTISPECIES: restriction endonuclease subunit S [unclassified Paenibacillus]KAF6562616.1 restriction endonuclease subunit S [Paenibacillus sp. EKM202P]KAF6567853.1 restriction endonuclease subunit S [Paenibacillus sp. EKM207P]